MKKHPISLFLSNHFFLALVCLSIIGCTSDEATNHTIPQEQISLDSTLSELVNQEGIPGVGAVVTNQDSILEMRVSGLRKNGGNEVIAMHDQFHIGSITKSMTACMIARLVESGHLRWDSHPSDVLPGIANIDSRYTKVTLIDMLRHRAGFPSDEEITEIPNLVGSLPEQRLQLAQIILTQAPTVPRGKFHYSNIGYTIAAAMAETVTGKNWRNLMDSLLFTPLNMTVTYGWPAEARADAPWGHDSTFHPVTPDAEDPQMDVIEPAGFVSTDLTSLAKYLQFRMQMANGEYSLLKKESVDTLDTPIDEYAAGLVIQNNEGQIIYYHNGSNEYFYAHLAIVPQEKLAAVLVANAGGERSVGEPLEQALNQILEAYLGR